MPFTLSSISSDGNSFSTQVGGITQVALLNVGIGDIVINVISTAQFPSAGTLKIGEEYITYTGITATTFTGCTRGTSFSIAILHSIGATVSGVFVGTPDRNNNPDFSIHVLSDQNAKLITQLSSDSTVWTSSYNSIYNVYSNTTKKIVNTKGSLYFRIEYQNLSNTIANVNLTTSFGKFDSKVPYNTYPATNIGEGRIPGETELHIIGKNTDLGLTAEDIWTPGGTLQWLTIAQTMTIVSTSLNDTLLGSGARNIRISGLDSNYEEISEIISLAGLVPVITSNLYLRINNVSVIEAGSLEWNDGTITITATIGLTIQSQIEPEESISTCSNYTVPANKNLYILRGEFNSARDISDPALLDFKGYVRNSNSNAPFKLFYEQRMSTDVQNEIIINMPTVQKITPMSDIVFRAISDKNTTYCNVRAYCLLVDII